MYEPIERRKLYELIDHATKRVYVWNQELNDPAMLQHLLDARKRNVEVKVLLGVRSIKSRRWWFMLTKSTD